MIEFLGICSKGIYDFRSRRLFMNPSVRLIVELIRKEAAMLVRQFFDFDDHPRRLMRWICQNDLGTKKGHRLASLHRKGFAHDADERIANHGETNARVAIQGPDTVACFLTQVATKLDWNIIGSYSLGAGFSFSKSLKDSK
jgi:hypothetical protein